MAVRNILQMGNPLLWEKSSPVEDVSSPDVRALIRDLDDTLAAFRKANGFGRAIAAPQVGLLKRVVFVRMQPDGFCGSLINPRIIWEDSERVEVWDNCLSFPDLLVKVSRAAQAQVEYSDENGERQEIVADGDLSELLQHEIDHLNGILALQRAVSPHAFATRYEWLRRK